MKIDPIAKKKGDTTVYKAFSVPDGEYGLLTCSAYPDGLVQCSYSCTSDYRKEPCTIRPELAD